MQITELRTANKGEWSELYVLFKLFQDKQIAAANAELEPVADKHYKFLKIFREEQAGHELEYNLENDNAVVIMNKAGEVIKTLDTSQLGNKTQKIFEAIKAASNSTFSMEELVDLMEDYLIKKVKASSQEKTDLLAILDDQTNITNDKMGFSIKSHVGGAPTLINSSSQTNFLFEVNNFSGDIETVNSIEGKSKVRDRLQAIYSSGGKISFVQVASPTFTTNLRFTDTLFPKILAYMLLDFYSGKGNNLEVLSGLASTNQELGISKEEVEYKLKGFLRSSALGMVPSKVWDTQLSTYGGYIVVLDNGSLVCYSLLKDDDFKNYLFNATRFDTPSTTRHNYGKLFEQNGKLYINLNLQIRFKK
jgi:hypothetical protein